MDAREAKALTEFSLENKNGFYSAKLEIIFKLIEEKAMQGFFGMDYVFSESEVMHERELLIFLTEELVRKGFSVRHYWIRKEKMIRIDWSEVHE